MTSGYAPNKLNDRHFVMALMLASGYRQCDVARTLGYSENRVSILANSPLFQAQMAELRTQLRESTLADAMAMIEREAATSVQVLVGIRDDDSAGVAGNNTRRLAANDLLDRHPTLGRHSKTETEHVLRIAFSAADVRQMQAALPTGAVPATEEQQGGEREPVVLRTLDEALAAAEVADG